MCERPAPRTLEEFGRPINAHLWRITENGKTLTYDEYERQYKAPLSLQLAALASIAMGAAAGRDLDEDDDE